MSAVSLKPSAILEATFSATWFGLQQKVKVTVLCEPWHFSWHQQEICLKRCENYTACLQTGTRYRADATLDWSQKAKKTPAPLFSTWSRSQLCLGKGFLNSKMLTADFMWNERFAASYLLPPDQRPQPLLPLQAFKKETEFAPQSAFEPTHCPASLPKSDNLLKKNLYHVSKMTVSAWCQLSSELKSEFKKKSNQACDILSNLKQNRETVPSP